jgi:WD40 repeat protein
LGHAEGEPLRGHTAGVAGVRELRDGRILSWSNDSTLRLWTASGGAAGRPLTGHTEPVVGAQELSNGRILSWSRDGTLRLWSRTGSARATIRLDAEILAVAGGNHDLRIIAERFNRVLIYDLVLTEAEIQHDGGSHPK